jgi:multidrug resistance efflux pump
MKQINNPADEQEIAGQARNDKALLSERSEEINDIVDRMPMAFGRWVAIAVVIFAALLLLFGWIIKYPDTVIGHIVINSNTAPVKLVANVSGNIHQIAFQVQDEVKQGDYIAVIENSAYTDDIRKIIGLLNHLNFNEPLEDSIQAIFPEKVSLGDLNLKYYAFLSALKNKFNYGIENVFEKQRAILADNIIGKTLLLSESGKTLHITQQKLDISKKWLEKYTSLNKEEIVTYEYELDRSKAEYLSARQEEQNLKKEMASIKIQITESQNHLNQLQVEQQEKERQLQMDLLASYHDLNDNLKVWEQKYVFKTPVNGRVEYLKFLTDNQFVQAGEALFGIVPKESNILGQVLLPAAGAGKVSTGSRVTIKLENYPYMEYGSIEGKVASISLLSQAQRTEQTTIDTYLVTVELPHGLTTNYGQTLDFQYEIGGSADIIVKERRLIERLFDNLKYKTK